MTSSTVSKYAVLTIALALIARASLPFESAGEVAPSLESALPGSGPAWISLAELEAGRAPQDVQSRFEWISRAPESAYMTPPDGGGRCAPFITTRCGNLGFLVGGVSDVFDLLGLALLRGTVESATPGVVGGDTLVLLLEVRIEEALYPLSPGINEALADERQRARTSVAVGGRVLVAFPAVPRLQFRGIPICADLDEMPAIPEVDDEIVALLDSSPLDSAGSLYSPLTRVLFVQGSDEPIQIPENWRTDPLLQELGLGPAAPSPAAPTLDRVFAFLAERLEGER